MRGTEQGHNDGDKGHGKREIGPRNQDELGRRLWFETQTARAPSPRYSEGVVGLLYSSIVGKGRAIIFVSQYNAMQVAVDARSWRSVSG